MKIEYIKRIVEQIVIAHDEYRTGMEELIDEVRKRLPEKDPITDRMLLSTVATTEMNSTLKQLLEMLD